MIDSHMHYGDDAPEVLAFLEAHDLKFLNICIAWSGGVDWRDQAVRYSDLTQRYPHRFAWCTSFDLPEPTDHAADYVDRVCAQLAQDFANGAIACKIWKNIGMEQRKADGSFVLPDDPNTLSPEEDKQCQAWWDLIVSSKTQGEWRRTRTLYDQECRKPLQAQ